METGSSNMFVDAARLMDLERAVEGNQKSSRVIIIDSLYRSVENEQLREQWNVSFSEQKGKHNVKYNVAVLAYNSAHVIEFDQITSFFGGKSAA